MNKKFFVPYQTAKLLRKAGYPQSGSDMYYNPNGKLMTQAEVISGYKDVFPISITDCYASPTYHEVVDWLEEKGIHITCYAPLLKPVGRYAISVFNSNTNNINDWGLCRDAYPTREKALNEGILKALEML